MKRDIENGAGKGPTEDRLFMQSTFLFNSFIQQLGLPGGKFAEIFSCCAFLFGCLKATDVFFSANLGLLIHFHLKPRFSSKVSQNLDAAEWIYGAKTTCFDFGERRK